MPTREENLELKPESQFVTKESFREELDLVKNNLKFVRSQTFNKRQCQGALGIFIILSVAANIVLGFLLYKNQVWNIIYWQIYLDLEDFFQTNYETLIDVSTSNFSEVKKMIKDTGR